MTSRIDILTLAETESTNDWVKAHAAGLEGSVLVRAVSQTRGRGQRGNSWESEPAANFTGSLFAKSPGVKASCQFSISEAVSLAVVDALARMGVAAKVKWPNDIYAGDRKICGILIENSLLGSEIMHSIIGIGLNLNQKSFKSDAPNPVSVWQLTGRECSVEGAATELCRCLERRLEECREFPETIHESYLEALWRGDGREYPFIDKLSGESIPARVAGVGRDGMLTLERTGGERRVYAFKEVEWVL